MPLHSIALLDSVKLIVQLCELGAISLPAVFVQMWQDF